MIEIFKKDESSLFIKCDFDEALDIQSWFEFYADGYMFSPQYKMGRWDGKIKLFNVRDGSLPIGLYHKLIKNLKRDGYDFKVHDEVFSKGKKISTENVLKFADKVLRAKYVPYSHQTMAVQYFLYLKKCIVESSTASGKSYIAFLIFNLLKYMNEKFNFLLIVPTIQLVSQMKDDFVDYGSNLDDYRKYIHEIYGGKDKHTDKPITISTWQSLQKLPESYFKKFDVVLIDEVHKATGKQISRIMTCCVNAEYKFGLTGTLDKGKANVLQVEGLFGHVKRVSKTKDLIKKKLLSDIKIFAVILKYNKSLCKMMKDLDYDAEAKYVNSLKEKQRYVCKLANSRKGNTLILFRKREYGTALFDRLTETSKKKIFYVDGTIKVDERNEAKRYCEENDNAIVVASYGTFSTGINIRNLHHIIFGESTKSMISVLQSIGRGLRKHASKTTMFLYDVVDNFQYGQRKNYMLKHFFERITYYDAEEFKYTVKEVSVN